MKFVEGFFLSTIKFALTLAIYTWIRLLFSVRLVENPLTEGKAIYLTQETTKKLQIKNHMILKRWMIQRTVTVVNKENVCSNRSGGRKSSNNVNGKAICFFSF